MCCRLHDGLDAAPAHCASCQLMGQREPERQLTPYNQSVQQRYADVQVMHALPACALNPGLLDMCICMHTLTPWCSSSYK